MKKNIGLIFLLIMLSATACNDISNLNKPLPTKSIGITTNSPKPNASQTPLPSKVAIDYEKIKPNEVGKVMVLMFHNFIETYEKGDKEYTITLNSFKSLLNDIYKMGFRPVSMTDYLNNNINLQAGLKPIVFTFDDATSGQFQLKKVDSKLTVEKNTAVGIMEEFNKTHPDFILNGTFYINMSSDVFGGDGTLSDRFKYLIDKGFEIGNHTFSHMNLKKIESAEEIQKELGENFKNFKSILPEGKMESMALPLGISPPTDLKKYLLKGIFQGQKYLNKGILLVGANPSYCSIDNRFDSLAIPRIRAKGIEPVKYDSDWWFENFGNKSIYISDGKLDTISVPKDWEEYLNKKKLNGKKLVLY